MGIDAKWNIKIGVLEPGNQNAITDVPHVKVGQITLAKEGVQTGVTVIHPHEGNLFREKVLAGQVVFNGFGKSAGLVQVEELGTIETPIVLTNTFAVGTAIDGVLDYMLPICPEIGTSTGTINPVILECNDGYLNDIRGRHITRKIVVDTLNLKGTKVEEGAVGAGRGMKCHGLKGGIGTASRKIFLGGKEYIVGGLVLSNHGLLKDLIVGGNKIGKTISKMVQEPAELKKDKGSVITILATNLPLSEKQLTRMARRTQVGLARTGSFMTNGSGEIAIAFTNGTIIPHRDKDAFRQIGRLSDTWMDIVFRAVAEIVEEAVLSSMLHAEEVTGKEGRVLHSLSDFLI